MCCQDQKSQHKNLDKALKVLRTRLYELEVEKRRKADSAKRKSMVSSGDRSAKIRTYNYPQGRVTEHRISLTLYDLSKIINGDIQKIIDELMLAENSGNIKFTVTIMNKKEIEYQIRKKKSFLSIGLDSDINKIPDFLKRNEDPLFAFNKAIIDSTNKFCVCYKINTAFYESQGSRGWKSMEKQLTT